mmetsp:Transcript_13370/g.34169  ORF Transcript_13370/g.34169 Transcript_13370/m.34169 type:complete len:308 (-) Transcript_13370:73-996(-)
MVPLVTKSVPPTAVMYGDAAGKSGWYFPPWGPSRPRTPWSPDAKSTEIPAAPIFWNWVLHCSMKAFEVCCASSLPYDTLMTIGISPCGKSSTCWAHEKREYWAFSMSVSGMAPPRAPMYSMSNMASAQTSSPMIGTSHLIGLFPPICRDTFTGGESWHASENFVSAGWSHMTPWNSATAMFPLAVLGDSPRLYALVSTLGVTKLPATPPHLPEQRYSSGKPAAAGSSGTATGPRRGSGRPARSPTNATLSATAAGSEWVVVARISVVDVVWCTNVSIVVPNAASAWPHGSVTRRRSRVAASLIALAP